MHLLAEEPQDPTLEHMVRVRGRRQPWVAKLRAATLAFAARLFNYRKYSDTWRVDLDGLQKGDVRVVLSVLYQPFDEMDLDELPGAPPEESYYDNLLGQLGDVEKELSRLDPQQKRHVVVQSADDLAQLSTSKRVGFLHCVEGGFHLGGNVEDIDRRVEELASRGVVYITLAHLFWRQVATNAPALPFLPDPLYNFIFRQPRGAGLAPLGEAAVRAMYRHRVLIDISHMREDAIDATFGLLRELDEQHRADPKDFPVIATHAGFRCGRQSYNLSPDTVTRIKERDGVIGLILAQHQLNDGIRRHTKNLDQSMSVICRHINAIHRVTRSYDQVAIGSDFDGFIKPTMGGLERVADFAKLRAPLERDYPGHADAILSGNAVRVLHKVLAARPA